MQHSQPLSVFFFFFLSLRHTVIEMRMRTAAISTTTATPTATPTPMESVAAEDWPEEEVWSVEGMGDGEVNWVVAVEVGEGLERVWEGKKGRHE